jgi:hypothetical protein
MFIIALFPNTSYIPSHVTYFGCSTKLCMCPQQFHLHVIVSYFKAMSSANHFPIQDFHVDIKVWVILLSIYKWRVWNFRGVKSQESKFWPMTKKEKVINNCLFFSISVVLRCSWCDLSWLRPMTWTCLN